MKQKQLIALALFGMVAGASLFADQAVQENQTNHETAWERKSMDKCKREMQKNDESTFSAALSPYAKKQYQGFSSDQRRKAMDYADHNNMSPDDAVAKVAGQR
jgi:hypothetical protein